MQVTAPPRDDLERSAAFDIVRAEDTGDGLTLEGYGAVFDVPTRIDSWEGEFDELIARGAFRKSIRERTPRIQFDHGHHPLIGSIPIGAITQIDEDDRGLHVVARISNNWLMQPVRDAIAEGSIDGMSFRFTVVREEWRDAAGTLVKPGELEQLLWNPGDRGPLQRTLKEVKVAEVGPVVWPAYDSTTVGVRARNIATAISDDDQMRRQIQRALANGTDPGEAIADDELRGEIARALLFKTPDAPLEEHPSEPETPDPAPQAHPGPAPDAPPADGHPSPSIRTSQLKAHISEITALMGDVLASIEKE
jgi:HK97 family phage prohead protease